MCAKIAIKNLDLNIKLPDIQHISKINHITPTGIFSYSFYNNSTV